MSTINPLLADVEGARQGGAMGPDRLCSDNGT